MVIMQEKSQSPDEVLSKLKKMLSTDFDFNSGNILGSMCSKPLKVAIEAYYLAFEKNLGDEFLFSGSVEMEKETISMLGSLLSKPNASGHIISGGTEANITALYVAKKLNSGAKKEVILPESAHFSFDRAADILDLKLVKIPLTQEYQIDVKKVEESINNQTLAIVAIAGSTGLGVVDPINELSDISIDSNVYLHVDAAFGGFVIPFLNTRGSLKILFGFDSIGVKSITIDPHKMGLCPIPAGGLLFRDASYLQIIKKQVSYIGNGKKGITTISGTRSASAAATVWATMKILGRNGYKRIVENCMKNTMLLYEGLKQIDGIKIMVKPTMNIVGFKCMNIENSKVMDNLMDRGWNLSLFPTHIRVVVMPHTTASHLKSFLSDLKEVLNLF
jgi:tyrosine decarboxylase/aspartate 1-decarboxylase